MLDFDLIGKDGFTRLEPNHDTLYRPASSNERHAGLRINGGDLTENFFYVRSFLPPSSLVVNIHGNSRNNKILLGDRSRLRGHLNISGSNNTFIDVGGGQEQNVQEINFHGDNNLIYLGQGVTSNGTIISAQTNCSVLIGDDVMLSQDVVIRSSDMHGIFDTVTGELISSLPDTPQYIIVFPHVWIGQDATVLKNTVIGPGSIIGASSVVTKNIAPRCIAAGISAKELRHEASWSRHRYPLLSHKEATVNELQRYARTFDAYCSSRRADPPAEQRSAKGH